MIVHTPWVLPPSPPADRLPPDIRDTTSQYRIDLIDGGVLMLRLEKGILSLEERAGDADCRLRCSRAAVPRILNGEMNLLTALSRGDIHVSGDLESAKRLHRYLRLAKGQGGQP